MTSNPPVYFYNPERVWYEGKDPEKVDNYGKMFQHGHLTWIVQTYMRLTNSGFECELIDTIPDEGIIIAHSEHLPDKISANYKQLFIQTKADREPNRFAQLQVVQNPLDPLVYSRFGQWNAHFIPHWPQVGLITRDPTRENKIENVSYFGQDAWLSPQLKTQEFKNKMNSLGLNFRIMPPERWNDYSDTDIVLAIRSFDNKPYYDKPATKLYVAWIAGAPAILGNESAYQAERKNEYDYFYARDTIEIIHYLSALKNNSDLYNNIVKNGRARSKEILAENITKKWINFLKNEAFSAYNCWRGKTHKERARFFIARSISHELHRIRRLLNLKHPLPS